MAQTKTPRNTIRLTPPPNKFNLKMMISESQLKFIADVLVTIGEVCLVALVVPYFMAGGSNPGLFTWGATATIGSWIIGFIISKHI